ncbi:MAG TPA: cytochrome b [Rhizomicrobium sp.]|jgi:cytochrome b561|nr:cytochrome b [Rhizomicrobium sp.]HEX4532844.1 cytochrome b [Rhizomicrobium sp.]
MATIGFVKRRYDAVAAGLHWVIAAALIFQLWLGLYMGTIPRSDPSGFAWVQFHKSLGLTILVLSLARLGWRLANPAPPLPASMNVVLKGLAHISHFLLYFLIIALPLSGWAMTSASALGLPIRYFGLFDWPKIWIFADMARADKKPWSHFFGSTHEILAYTTIALIVIHVCAAIAHQIFWRDEVLKRMIPGTRLKGEA